MQYTKWSFVLLTPFILVGPMAAAEKVPVVGSEITFAATITSDFAGKQVPLVLTGTALREKFFLNVYAMASYIEKDAKVKSAEDLARADVPKELYLVLERDVAAQQMADAVKASITANHPESEFPKDLKAFLDFIAAGDVQRGDRVRITHLPGVGIRAEILGKRHVTIKNLRLAQAVWEIYLGKKNMGLAIKQGLISRL